MIPILDLKAQYESIKLEAASRLPRRDRVACFSTSQVLGRQHAFLCWSSVCTVSALTRAADRAGVGGGGLPQY